MSKNTVYRIAKFVPLGPTSPIWKFESERIVTRNDPDDVEFSVAPVHQVLKVVSKYGPTHQNNVFDFDSSWIVLPSYYSCSKKSLFARLRARFFSI